MLLLEEVPFLEYKLRFNFVKSFSNKPLKIYFKPKGLCSSDDYISNYKCMNSGKDLEIGYILNISSYIGDEFICVTSFYELTLSSFKVEYGKIIYKIMGDAYGYWVM